MWWDRVLTEDRGTGSPGGPTGKSLSWVVSVPTGGRIGTRRGWKTH